MARFFLGNFDFEHRLAEPKRQTSAKLQRLNAELATAWLSIAEDGDWVWTPSPIDARFFDQAVRAGLPRVNPVTSFHEVPAGIECIPWGWSADAVKLVKHYAWHATVPCIRAVTLANSRATSDELERRWNVGLEMSRRIESRDELNAALRLLSLANADWVIKAEFGMSARERIRGRGPMTVAQEHWLNRRIRLTGRVFIEPWVKRVSEIGIQIDVPESGEPRLIGLTPMVVDAGGQYAGNWFAFDQSRFQAEYVHWPRAVEIALRAASHLQSEGYFGPLGIDAMIYRDDKGDMRVRPLQDINARWTMGRLSLGWTKLLEPNDEGCWQHGANFSDSIIAEHSATRTVSTSSESVGGIACHHRSRLVIHATDESVPQD